MSKYSVNDTTLIGIADAIRSKEGSSGSILVPDLASRILNLSGSATMLSGTWVLASGAPYVRLNVGVTLSDSDIFVAICTGDNNTALHSTSTSSYHYPLSFCKTADHVYGTALYSNKSSSQLLSYDDSTSNFSIQIYNNSTIYVGFPYDVDANLTLSWYLLQGV